jgi:hypothetical protein
MEDPNNKIYVVKELVGNTLIFRKLKMMSPARKKTHDIA